MKIESSTNHAEQRARHLKATSWSLHRYYGCKESDTRDLFFEWPVCFILASISPAPLARHLFAGRLLSFLSHRAEASRSQLFHVSSLEESSATTRINSHDSFAQLRSDPCEEFEDQALLFTTTQQLPEIFRPRQQRQFATTTTYDNTTTGSQFTTTIVHVVQLFNAKTMLFFF